ncbi:MAG: Cu2+-exporting ATPase, partial [Ilumatobacter sp.]
MTDHTVVDHNKHAEHAEHDDHGGNGGGHAGHADMFRIAFWRNLALAIPVLVFSAQIQEWFNYDWSFP